MDGNSEPYLWRYRVEDRFGEIDMLLLPDPSAGENISEDLTIVTWDVYETDAVEYQRPRRLHIERDPDRARLKATEETVTAVGVQLPSGAIIIEWRREAFEPDDRANDTVTSRYESIEDAEQATAGTVVFDDGEQPREV